MAGKKTPSSRRKSSVSNVEGQERELIVITKADVGLRTHGDDVASVFGADTTPLTSILGSAGASIVPTFGEEIQLDSEAASFSASPSSDPDLIQFYNVEAKDAQLEELAEKLQASPLVESAYIKPPAELAVIADAPEDLKESEEESINDMPPSDESPAATPLFVSRQKYLNPAPVGVDAPHAWRYNGGRGRNVRIIDLEWGWNFNHEDLRQNQGGVIAGNNSANNNHGTAVIGVIGGDRNGFGVTGISPDATVSAISFTTIRTARAIRMAADRLRPGDIMLLEIHRRGPAGNGQGQHGYIAVEWWPDDFAAIRYATRKGVIVVEAAGNGAQNLDAPIYNTRPRGFPAGWRNPFNPGNPSSSAVLVGAGAPPAGTHGRDHGPDRSRLGFSNYGRRVDCQGWGREVTTTGYGDLQGGANQNRHYTDRFSGTSSASPCVVGAIACLQGILRARGARILSPASAIRLLRTTGSPQTNAPGRPRNQRIGNRPNLRQMIARFIRPSIKTVPFYRYWKAAGGDHFYTTNLKELGKGRLGYRYEGVQCFIFPRRIRGSVPLYRYWNSKIVDHFYTTNFRELGRGKSGYSYEGIQGYVLPRRVRGSVPLYRYWNARIGDHFYTTNIRELGRGRNGYRYEGVQCYVFPRSVSMTPSLEESQAQSIVAEDSATEYASHEDTLNYNDSSTFSQHDQGADGHLDTLNVDGNSSELDGSQSVLERMGISSFEQLESGEVEQGLEYLDIPDASFDDGLEADFAEESNFPSHFEQKELEAGIVTSDFLEGDAGDSFYTNSFAENSFTIESSFPSDERQLDDSFTPASEYQQLEPQDSFNTKSEEADEDRSITINLNLKS